MASATPTPTDPVAVGKTPARPRPLSPHVLHYRWGPHMFVSILHRATGDGLAIGGALTLLTWLGCAAAGGAAYDGFIGFITTWSGQALLVALSWGFFQHAASGLRHLLLDTGAGYGLPGNRLWAIVVSASGTILTAMLWLLIWYGRL